MEYIPYIIIAFLVIVVFFLLFKQSKEKPDWEAHNRKIQEAYKNLYDEVEKEREKAYAGIKEKKQQMLEEYNHLKRQQEYEIQSKYKESHEQLQNELERRRNDLLSSLDEEIKLRQEKNKQLKIELANWIEEEKLNAEIQVQAIQTWIEEWRSKQEAVVESYKKLDELQNKDSHYRIIFSEDEEVELIELNKAIRKLKNPLPFRKAVYDVYYKPKINELVLRVVGKAKVSGIYKITHMQSGRTYVGQSVDIGNRWKQHAKRGCGADILTQNKLYPAMLEFGVESFQFEIIEEIEDTTKLNEAEKYWQNYFKSQEFGYSMK